MSESLAYNMDCMELLRNTPDKAFDLAVVDPPYGGGCSQFVQVERERERESCTEHHLQGGHAYFEGRSRSRFGGRFDKYHISQPDGRNVGNEVSDRRCL